MRITLAYLDTFIGISGGLERVLCQLANAMTHRGHTVSILYCHSHSGRPVYPLSEAVSLINLMDETPWRGEGKRPSQCLPTSARLFRETLRVFSQSAARSWNQRRVGRLLAPAIRTVMDRLQPDVILSYWPETSYFLIHHAHVSVPIVSMFHSYPDRHLNLLSPDEHAALARSACLQTLLPSGRALIATAFPHVRIEVIPNPIPSMPAADLAAPRARRTLLYVGRLEKRYKQPHLLIDAFARVAADCPDWDLELWGGDDRAGRYEAELRRLIESHHLEHRVFLRGKTEHVEDVYRRGDLFCLPSASEGFGLSLGEAMSAGLPAVGFRSCPAVNELIADGETGLLAEDGADGLADALRRLMMEPAARISMGQAARKSMAAYAPDRIWDAWENLLTDIARTHSR